MNQVFMTYLDFELEIGPGRGRDYPVAVTHSPAGEAHATMRFPYDESTLEKRLVVLQNGLLGSGGGPLPIPAPEELVVRDFGRDLFEALFTGEVRRCYEQSIEQARQEDKGLRFKLSFQPSELAALPWEFLYDARRAEYVCLSHNMPLVRCLELPWAIPPLNLSPPLRILGVIAGPGDPESPNVAREKERVETALQGLQAQGLAELTWLEGQTQRHLQEAMKRGTWHIVHFLGQSDSARRDPDGDQISDKGFAALAGEEGDTRRLSAADLPQLLADHRSLRVALLSARAGTWGGQSQGRASLRNLFSGIAVHLTRQGIPAVLAMPYEITDAAAIELLRALYEALALGMPVDTAVAEARQAVSSAVANTVEWGALTLFVGSPDMLVPSPTEGLRSVQAQVIEGTPVQVLEPKPAPAAPPRKVEEARRERRPKRETPIRPRQPVEPEPAPAAPPPEVEEPRREWRPEPETLIRPRQPVEPAPEAEEARRERRPEPETLIRPRQPVEPEPVPAAPPPEAEEPRRERRPEPETLIRPRQPVEPEPVPAAPPSEAEEARRERRPKQTISIRTPLPIEPEMVLIPAGEFLMGSDPERDQDTYEAEQPQHRVYLPDYHIARMPITNAQYAAFVEARGYEAPSYWVNGKAPDGKDGYPVAYVSWYDAMAYCKWLSEKTGQSYRLPSEAEWEKAARGPDGGIYPWGDTWDPGCCNSKESSRDDTTLVYAYRDGASPYGILDMAGNVWEWTGSLYRPYPYDAKDGREAPRSWDKRVLRSGAFYSTARRVRCAYRDSGYADDSRGSYGFRVVRAPG